MYTAEKRWTYHEIIEHEALDSAARAAYKASFVKGAVASAANLPTTAQPGDTVLVLSERTLYSYDISVLAWLPVHGNGSPLSTAITYSTTNTDQVASITEQYSTMQMVYTPTYDSNGYITQVVVTVNNVNATATLSTATISITNNTSGNITNIS